MARSGSVCRFLKPCAVAAFLALAAACGGDGDPTLPEVVRVTVAHMPDLPLAPTQSAQLTATATYSDGALNDVTDTAIWETTDPGVLTVSAIGLMTATGPGKADVSASFGGKSGSVSVQVVALPAAYFVDGVEYAFDYQLDAQGRVASYRISRRSDIDYGNEPWQDIHVKDCTGDLHGTYTCATNQTSMAGQGGMCVGTYSGPMKVSTTYSYGQFGLNRVISEMRGLGSHRVDVITKTLNYDALGRLHEVLEEGWTNDVPGCVVAWATKTAITLDSRGRLLRAEGVPQLPSTPCHSEIERWSVKEWMYSASGFLEKAALKTTDEKGTVISESLTSYEVDDSGWVVADGGNAYSITRAGERVAEEQFTQALPRAFYIDFGAQRIRYEWGRLPSEPLFVPRALTGLDGADYFGIISSHHR